MKRSDSEIIEARRFFLSGFLFLIPLAAVFAFPLAVLSLSGELLAVDEVIARQIKTDTDTLYGPAYSNASRYYKLRSVLTRRPEVLVLGTSRTMQIRSNFFKHPETFYNAGGGVGRIKHFRAFLNHLPRTAQPKLLIVGLDQYFFNPNFEIMAADDIEYRLSKESVSPLAVIQFSWLKTYIDWFQGKFRLAPLVWRAPERIGISAIVRSRGFRNDGSYDYGTPPLLSTDPNAEDYQFKDTFARIQDGRDAYEHSDTHSEATLRELDLFLQECSSRDIRVVAFLPPYAHAVHHKMLTSGNFRYLTLLNAKLQEVFSRNKATLHDFSDVSLLGVTDEQMHDGFHATEYVFRKLIRRMSKSIPELYTRLAHEV